MYYTNIHILSTIVDDKPSAVSILDCWFSRFKKAADDANCVIIVHA